MSDENAQPLDLPPADGRLVKIGRAMRAEDIEEQVLVDAAILVWHIQSLFSNPFRN